MDVAVKPSDDRAACIARDLNGSIIHIKAAQGNSDDPLVVEAMAARLAENWAKENVWQRVSFEGDNAGVIDAINSSLSPPWRIEALINDIKDLISSNPQWTWSKINRRCSSQCGKMGIEN